MARELSPRISTK